MFWPLYQYPTQVIIITCYFDVLGPCICLSWVTSAKSLSSWKDASWPFTWWGKWVIIWGWRWVRYSGYALLVWLTTAHFCAQPAKEKLEGVKANPFVTLTYVGQCMVWVSQVWRVELLVRNKNPSHLLIRSKVSTWTQRDNKTWSVWKLNYRFQFGMGWWACKKWPLLN